MPDGTTTQSTAEAESSLSYSYWLGTFVIRGSVAPLDRIGMELQNPFSTHRIDFLPLDSICTSIERNVLELLHDIEDEPAAAPRPSDVELPSDADVPKQSENALADIS